MRKCIERTVDGKFKDITVIKATAADVARKYFEAFPNVDMSDLMNILFTEANHQRTVMMLQEISPLDRIKQILMDNIIVFGHVHVDQIFDCDNVVGDPVDTLFDENGVTVKVCRGNGYFDVVGLSPEDFADLEEFFTDFIHIKKLEEIVCSMKGEL